MTILDKKKALPGAGVGKRFDFLADCPAPSFLGGQSRRLIDALPTDFNSDSFFKMHQ